MVMSVQSDLLFKRCMANAKHPEVPIGFLSDVLGLSVDTITIENPYRIEEFEADGGSPDMRQTEVDILVRLKDKRLITTELQRLPQAHFIKRSTFYMASRFVEDYDRKEFRDEALHDGSEKYSTLHTVYGINIAGFNIFNDKRSVRNFTLMDKDTKELLSTDGILNLCYLELKKKAPTHLRYWFDFFNDLPCAKSAPNYIKQAYKLVNYANMSGKERKVISVRERLEQDRIGQLNYARNEGRVEGRTEVARNFLALGTPIDVVQKATGLSVAELGMLQKQATGK
jgi:predicted transposase/invertase (TIGR01784 family)